MKLLLDVRESKADFVIELLKNLSFVKTKKVKTPKEEFVSGLKEAINEVNLHKQGKIKLQSARDFLNEL